MTGVEYMLSEVMEPHLFVIRKQKRDGPEKVTPMLTYYILDGSIYQAPQLSNVFAARIVSPSSNIFLLLTTTIVNKLVFCANSILHDCILISISCHEKKVCICNL